MIVEKKVDTIEQPVPYRYYKRVMLKNDAISKEVGQKVIFDVDYGYCFAIKNIYCQYSELRYSESQINGLNIQINDANSGKKLIPEPSPVFLVGSPNGAIFETVPNPYLAGTPEAYLYTVESKEAPVLASKFFPYVTTYRGSIQIELKINDLVADDNYQIPVDIMLFGYLTPNTDLNMWSK